MFFNSFTTIWHTFFILFFNFCYLCISQTTVYAQEVPIQFIENVSWEQLLEKAQNEGKFIFIDVYTDFCAPCKLMDNKVFKQQNVGIYYNQNFINVKMNMLVDAHENFMMKYELHSAPSLMFFSPNGELIDMEVGYMSAEKFLALGQEIQSMYEDIYIYYIFNEHYTELKDNSEKIVIEKPNEPMHSKAVNMTYEPKLTVYADSLHTPVQNLARFANLDNAYRNGNINILQMRQYAYFLKEYRKPYNTIVNKYLNAEKNNLKSKENKVFIYDFSVNLENNAIDHFLAHLDNYKVEYGSKKVNEKVRSAILHSVMTAIKERDYGLFEKAKKIIATINIEDKEWFLFKTEALFYQGIEKWSEYTKVVSKYLHVHNIDDPFLLNDFAAKFQQFGGEKHLSKALKWINTSLKIEDEYYNNYTKALLLCRLNLADDALEAVEHAIEIGTTRQEDCSEAIDLKDRIKSRRF
ncbi:MAG: thioredoxin family protein [Chitinophagales bacterium]